MTDQDIIEKARELTSIHPVYIDDMEKEDLIEKIAQALQEERDKWKDRIKEPLRGGPMKKQSQEEFKCPHCGSTKGTWFDRTISYYADGTEKGMANRCEDCGMDVDEKPERKQ